MASQIAWLDASNDEQRRMREIIRLFTDRDSRDELGIGQVRDAISDGLFPGTSVLLTRARYLLFVPWCLQLAAGKPKPIAVAEKNERALIRALKDSSSDDLSGLLGARAGQQLKTLPSAIYWTPIRQYEIVNPGHSWASDVFLSNQQELRGDDDGEVLSPSPWHRNLPPVPPGFPTEVGAGFSMTRDEADWLRERILATAADSLLSHLVSHRPTSDSDAPWEDASAREVGGRASDLLRHAEAFSRVMHGAALLYNLLLAEEYELRVPDDQRRLEAPAERYRVRMQEWADGLEGDPLLDWRVDELWSWLDIQARTPIAHRSRVFVDSWIDLVQRADLPTLADSEDARRLIAAREKSQKGALARLGNPKRLSGWSGAAGAGALQFRWPAVRRIVLDIHDGLERA